MRKVRAILVVSSAVLCSTMFIAPVNADLMCKMNAKAAYKDCQAQCKSDFTDAKFVCRNIQPACGDACLAGRQACFDGVEEILDTGVVTGHCSVTMSDPCLIDAECPNAESCVADSTLANCTGGTNACNAVFTTQATGDPGSGGCGATCGPQGQVCSCHGDQACAECLDTAQVTRFLCRDECRDSFRVNPVVVSGKQGCSTSFKACAQACPPAM
jgi:hypothetical protein